MKQSFNMYCMTGMPCNNTQYQTSHRRIIGSMMVQIEAAHPSANAMKKLYVILYYLWRIRTGQFSAAGHEV